MWWASQISLSDWPWWLSRVSFDIFMPLNIDALLDLFSFMMHLIYVTFYLHSFALPASLAFDTFLSFYRLLLHYAIFIIYYSVLHTWTIISVIQLSNKKHIYFLVSFDYLIVSLFGTYYAYDDIAAAQGDNNYASFLVRGKAIQWLALRRFCLIMSQISWMPWLASRYAPQDDISRVV